MFEGVFLVLLITDVVILFVEEEERIHQQLVVIVVRTYTGEKIVDRVRQEKEVGMKLGNNYLIGDDLL